MKLLNIKNYIKTKLELKQSKLILMIWYFLNENLAKNYLCFIKVIFDLQQ